MHRVAVALAAALALAVSAFAISAFVGAADDGEYVFPPGATFGARLMACPVADCATLFHVAESWLDREQPGHPAVVRARLGQLACSRDPHMVCAISPPIGLRDSFEVVLDLAGRPDPVLVGIACWQTAENGGAPWNGGWCIGIG